MSLLEELRWRGLVHDTTPGLEELLESEQVTLYVGIDPTADSLHVGHFVSVVTLGHLQRAGHKPLAIVGGATGMIGDPSGKSAERNLLNEEELRHNETCIKAQLEKFLDFSGDNAAEVLNNYDWFQNMGYLEFIRDVGKHITVNYMMAKDSVKKRLDSGMSFTEFTYQLAQGYDFYHLYKERGCKLQVGGSDQWGNITTGGELIRRKLSGEAYALTWPLITKADGKKFGKTEEGNIWLDAKRTSPYKFYQFWKNSGDAEAVKYLRLFTYRSKEEIEAIEAEHQSAPHARVAQTALAEELTARVHSPEELEKAKKASSILFGKSTQEDLISLGADTVSEVFEGIPTLRLQRDQLAAGINLVDVLSEEALLKSKSEVRRALKENSLAVNMEKDGLSDETSLDQNSLLLDRFIVVKRGKKNFYLIVAE